MSAKIIAAIIILIIAVYALDSYMATNSDKKRVSWRDPLTDVVIIDINN